jgi:uncharacterized protein YjbJ (UPF0337 family)
MLACGFAVSGSAQTQEKIKSSSGKLLPWERQETIRRIHSLMLWRSTLMNNDQVSGKLDEVKGKVKEEWGKATGDTSTQIGGLKDQVKGNLKQTYGDAKEEAQEEVRREQDKSL